MGKHQKCPEFENHERWLVSYADMLTLLFAVFVVLYSLKQGGEPQAQQVSGSMQESFNTPLDDIPIHRKDTPVDHGFGIFEHFRGDQIREPLSKKFPSHKQAPKVLDQEFTKIQKELEERLYGPHAFPGTHKNGNERIIDVEKTPTGLRFRLLARHFYDSGSLDMKPKGLKALDVLIRILKRLGRPLTVEGHADSAPSSRMSHWDLSALRATRIVAYMVEKHYFPQTLLSAAGYGDVRPLAHNGTFEGRQLNRRIEIQVHYETQEALPYGEAP
jgi:chemotaxis protein MotB